jgi:hypothetical protein
MGKPVPLLLDSLLGAMLGRRIAAAVFGFCLDTDAGSRRRVYGVEAHRQISETRAGDRGL